METGSQIVRSPRCPAMNQMSGKQGQAETYTVSLCHRKDESVGYQIDKGPHFDLWPDAWRSWTVFEKTWKLAHEMEATEPERLNLLDDAP